MTKAIKALAMAAGLSALAACGGGADDQAAENIEAMTENRADALDQASENASDERTTDALGDQADNVEDMGELAAEKADDEDDAGVENQVANAM